MGQIALVLRLERTFFFLVAFFSLEEFNDLKCINRVKDLFLD